MSDNPLLSKLRIPGAIYQLPSGGFFYDNGELSSDTENGEIHVHPLSAITEINLKNPDMLFSGKAVESVFRECIPQIQKPLELFGRDVDAIMCYLRMVTYGTAYDVSAKHSCENSKQHKYTINLDTIARAAEILDPTTVKDRYTITLTNGQVVELEPIRFKHIVEMLQQADANKEMSVDDMKSGITKNLLNSIKSVDGIQDKALIADWILAVPGPIMNTLTAAIEKSNSWGLDYMQTVKCPDCGEEFTIEVPVNPVSFFSV